MALKITNRSDGIPEILLYDTIGGGWLGGITAKEFMDELRAIGPNKDIDVRIHSEGGSVFDGVAMYNALVNHKGQVNVYIDGVALSISSMIAMAGDTITMAENGHFMIHDPWGVFQGTADDLRTQAELMDQVRQSIVDTYIGRVGNDVPVSDMMHEEKWMAAEEAKQHGFIDSTFGEMRMAAKYDYKKFKHAPACLLNGDKNNTSQVADNMVKNKLNNDTARSDALSYMNVRTAKIRRC